MIIESYEKHKGACTTPATDPTRFWRFTPGMNKETVSVAALDADIGNTSKAIKDSMER